MVVLQLRVKYKSFRLNPVQSIKDVNDDILELCSNHQKRQKHQTTTLCFSGSTHFSPKDLLCPFCRGFNIKSSFESLREKSQNLDNEL